MRIGIDAAPFAFEQTGIGRYLGSMLEEMQALDASIEYLLYSPLPVTLPMRHGNWTERVVRSGFSQRPSLWAQIVLPSLLASDMVDAFWAQPTNLPISLKRRCLRVLTIHDLVSHVRPESMRFRTWLRMRAMLGPVARAADEVIADSRATAIKAHQYLGIRHDRMHVVYAGTPAWCRPVPPGEARALLAEEVGLTQEYVLCVSTIEPRKDHLTLLQVMELVPHAPLLVLVGGEGWRCKHILAAIRTHEKAGRVRYLGRVGDRLLPALYSAAKLSVYPSLYEGFGLPVLESMACGCPVLSSDSSSLPEVGGDAARYFRVGHAASLSSELRRLVSNDSELAEMSVAGFARATEFSFRRAAEKLLDVIRGGVARLRQPRS